MKPFRSIHWRLQISHGLLLVLVLAGFGFTAWRLQWDDALRRVDQELQQRVSVLASIRRAGRPDADRPPPGKAERPPGKGRLPFPRLRGHDANLFEGESGKAFYYVVWSPDGVEVARSPSAPVTVPPPDQVPGPLGSRLRGTLRECFHYTPPGECMLAGRDIRDELADLRRLAWLLLIAGGAVLAIGLAGGWLASTRALRPIADISAAAARIASGDLAQRIRTADTRSELGRLVGVLNDTFARLQAAFARQAQFTADAAHELRTPVSVVLTQTQAALARERPASEYRESLAACQRAAQRMRRLIDSLLALARLDAAEAGAARGPCDLDRVAAEAVELLRPLAEAQNVRVECDLAPAHCTGHAEQLAQVVSNLVSNAIHYNRPGGSVRVTTAAASGAAVLSVADTGVGIAAEETPRLFGRFYRADKSRSNANGHAGLGLAIVKAIVEAHDGSIEVGSEPGKGSTFTVRLPSP